MVLIPSIFLGPLRIVVFVLILYALNLLLSKKASTQNNLDYFVPHYAKLLGLSLVVGFLLIQLNAFDVLILLSIITSLLLFRFLNLNFKEPLKEQFETIRRRVLLYIAVKLERGQSLLGKKNFKKEKPRKTKAFFSSNAKKNRRSLLFLSIFIAVATYISRYIYLKFDTYSLSQAWFADLSNIHAIGKQQWFFHEGTMMGEYLIINLYGKLTGISFPAALESFGLIEAALLAIIIFYTLNKITQTEYIPGLVAAFSFIVLYAFIPIDLGLLAQHKSIYLGLSLALPTMLFCLQPELLHKKEKHYFIWMSCLFIGIFFIDLFVALVLLPPFLLIAAIFTAKSNPVFLKKAALAYFVAFALVSITYVLAAFFLQKDFLYFINSNLFPVDAYTYSPQLILPLDELLTYYKWAALGGLLVSIFLFIKNKSNWKYIVVLLAYINILFHLQSFASPIIDPDLLNEVFTVFIPLFFGLIIYLCLQPLGLLFEKYQERNLVYKIGFPIMVIGLLAFTTQNKLGAAEKSPVKTELLQAYEALNTSLLPYSYGIVDHQDSKVLAHDDHYFIGYDYFNTDYLVKDSLYFKHKNKLSYLKDHPEIVLPNSTFVFVYLKEENKQQKAVQKSIKLLKKRGRKVSTFFESAQIQVYEIENKPKTSKLKDLLF